MTSGALIFVGADFNVAKFEAAKAEYERRGIAFNPLDHLPPSPDKSIIPPCILLGQSEISIGRDENCNAVVNSIKEKDSVSRMHCRFGFETDKHGKRDVWIKDMDSTNGTFIGGVRLHPHRATRIWHGELLCLGGQMHLRQQVTAGEWADVNHFTDTTYMFYFPGNTQDRFLSKDVTEASTMSEATIQKLLKFSPNPSLKLAERGC